jgi:hypothetical protein
MVALGTGDGVGGGVFVGVFVGVALGLAVTEALVGVLLGTVLTSSVLFGRGVQFCWVTLAPPVLTTGIRMPTSMANPSATRENTYEEACCWKRMQKTSLLQRTG